MSVTAFSFTRDWTNPTDFPTVETSEAQVRFDFQDLHNQTKNKINELITDHNANIPKALTTADIDSVTT